MELLGVRAHGWGSVCASVCTRARLNLHIPKLGSLARNSLTEASGGGEDRNRLSL